MGNENDLKTRLSNVRIEWPDDEMVAIYKKKTPEEKIKIVSEMFESARLQITAVLRSQHPEWSENAIKKEVIKRLTSESL